MGEISVPRNTFLYEMDLWEINAVIRGYNRKQEKDWQRTRWQTYHNLLCMVDIKKAGINSMEDLLPLPHDQKTESSSSDLPTEEDIQELVADINRINAEHAKKMKEQNQTPQNTP